mmetsp:Transcript_114638/g.171459  ORF Transcript_114638/g.171459 Transcript_114638/m.171459 type:complete len:184 (-) Transcript_114638:157-708(-)
MFGKLLLVTLLLVVATDNASSKNAHLRRELKSDDGGGGGPLEEQELCVPFEDATVAISNTAAGDTCLTNTCPGGCCRLFNYLECDDDNTYPHLRCVCNDITNNTHIEVDDDRTDNSTDAPVIVFPAVAGDCDEGSPFQQIPQVTPCSQQSNCTGAGECCVKYFCFCKVPNLAFNEDLQCVPDP